MQVIEEMIWWGWGTSQKPKIMHSSWRARPELGQVVGVDRWRNAFSRTGGVGLSLQRRHQLLRDLQVLERQSEVDGRSHEEEKLHSPHADDKDGRTVALGHVAP